MKESNHSQLSYQGSMFKKLSQKKKKCYSLYFMNYANSSFGNCIYKKVLWPLGIKKRKIQFNLILWCNYLNIKLERTICFVQYFLSLILLPIGYKWLTHYQLRGGCSTFRYPFCCLVGLALRRTISGCSFHTLLLSRFHVSGALCCDCSCLLACSE